MSGLKDYGVLRSALLKIPLYADYQEALDALESAESRHRALVEALERIEKLSEYEMTEGLSAAMNIAHFALQEDNK